MANKTAKRSTDEKRKADMLHRTAVKMGRSFARASLEIDEQSTSGAAMVRVDELTEMLEETVSGMGQFAIKSGFCEGVAEQLRRAGKGAA